MATANDLRLTYETYILATPAQLWDAITNPELTQRYYYGTAVQSDFTPGSSIVYKGYDGNPMSDGTILEVQPRSSLVHTLRLTYDPQTAADRPSRVSWEIQPMGEVCKLTVVHDDFDGETKTYQDSSYGWSMILSGLKTVVETGQALPIPMGG